MNDHQQGTSQVTPAYTYVKHESQIDHEGQNSERKMANAHITCDNASYSDIPLYQIWNSQVNIEYRESSDVSRIVFQRHNETPPRINTESLSVTPEATYNVDDDDSDGSDGSESQSIDINAIAIDTNV